MKKTSKVESNNSNSKNFEELNESIMQFEHGELVSFSIEELAEYFKRDV